MTFAYFSSEKSRATPGRRTGFAPCKINAPPSGDYKFSPKILLHPFLHRKNSHRAGAAIYASAKKPHSPGRKGHKMKIDM